jgi:hypothetical protein
MRKICFEFTCFYLIFSSFCICSVVWANFSCYVCLIIPFQSQSGPLDVGFFHLLVPLPILHLFSFLYSFMCTHFSMSVSEPEVNEWFAELPILAETWCH